MPVDWLGRERGLAEELRSEKCFCGQKKMPGFTFCGRCYHRLPRWIQKGLFRRMGDGYEQARKRAEEFVRKL